MEKEQKLQLLRIIFAAALFICSFLIKDIGFVFCLVAYALVGWDVIFEAIKNIFKGEIFDEHFLMSLATVGAISLGEYSEAVAVMLFYQIGELFQDVAQDNSKKSIANLMNIKPNIANIEIDNNVVQISPNDLNEGDIIYIYAGEKVPVDCNVLDGETSLDTSTLTGESVPKEVVMGDHILSGCINSTSTIKCKVEARYADSTVSQVLDLIENAQDKKGKTENFITKFAKVYTPIVVIAAAILAIFPPLILHDAFNIWIERALTFLVISCPCALVISVPLSFFGGIGAASHMGALVKGSNYLEVIAKVKTVIFDKTGTLTKGKFAVTKLIPAPGVSQDDLLETMTYAESFSTHPISKSIAEAYKMPVDSSKLSDIEEISGHGICVKLDGEDVVCGNKKLMDKMNITVDTPDEIGTIIYASKNGTYIGCALIEDEPKEEAAETIAELHALGVENCTMLTGDSSEVATKVADKLQLNDYFAELLPGDKVNKVEEMLECGPVAFVGDGINDAPVIARADVGLSMGALGSDAAIEAADIVLMNDNLSLIPSTIKIARKTIKIAYENIAFALSIKALVLLLGALGACNMWMAVFADVGVSVIAVLNSMRSMKC